MSYEETEMRKIIDRVASQAEMDSSGLSQEEYCRLHPDDPICRSYDEVYPKRQMYQPPQEPEPEEEREPEPEPEPEPTYPPKPPPYEQPPKPPPEEDEQPSLPPYEPPKPPREDIPSLPTTEYNIKTDEYRGAIGGIDMYTKTCPVCEATVPAGTNFCGRCGYIIEVVPRGMGGTGGGGKGQGT